MNRRRFFSMLGGLAAAAAVVPVLDKIAPLLQPATIGEYANYCNFSSLSVVASIDEAAKELGIRAGQSIRELNMVVFDYQPKAFGRNWS